MPGTIPTGSDRMSLCQPRLSSSNDCSLQSTAELMPSVGLARAGVVAVGIELVDHRDISGFDPPPELMIDAIRMLRSALHDFVVLELGGGLGLPDDLDRRFELFVSTVISGIEGLALQLSTCQCGQRKSLPTVRGGHHVHHH